MRRLAVYFAIALFLLMPTSVTAAECEFVLGFKTLRDLIGHDIVGECLENQHHGANGDALQRTSGGLLAWRKADNWTAFTDGHRTWINGPNGLVQRLNTERFAWEADYAPGGAVATPTTVPALTPTPAPEDIPTPSVITIMPEPARTPAQAIEGLSWVGNGLNRYETPIVENLQSLAATSRGTFWQLIHKTWMQDGVTIPEMLSIDVLTAISRFDGPAAQRIVGMPFLDFVDIGDPGTLTALRKSAGHGTLQRLLAHPTLRGGVTDEQRAAVALLYLESRDPEAAATIGAFPWIQEGTTDADTVAATFWLLNLALENEKLFQAVIQRGWLQDGISRDELSVLQRFQRLTSKDNARQDEAAFLRIFEMPFLDSIDGADLAALEALSRVFWATEQDLWHQVLAHPALRAGITDDQAVLVSVLGEVAHRAPDSVSAMLDPAQVIVWKRTLELGEYGNIDLAVVSSSQEASGNMDWLEHAVRAHVEFMGTPLPRDYVALWIHARGGGGGGPTGILNVGEFRNPEVVAHEAAHVYWPFFPSWIAEGAATFMASVSENARIGTSIRPFNPGGCSLTNNLSRLDQLYQELGDTLQGCQYILGSGLFVDLYHSLGDEEFRKGFRTLFLKMQDRAHFFECTGLEQGLCYVKAAFVTDAAPGAATIAESIINRWYYGSASGAP